MGSGRRSRTPWACSGTRSTRRASAQRVACPSPGPSRERSSCVRARRAAPRPRARCGCVRGGRRPARSPGPRRARARPRWGPARRGRLWRGWPGGPCRCGRRRRNAPRLSMAATQRSAATARNFEHRPTSRALVGSLGGVLQADHAWVRSPLDASHVPSIDGSLDPRSSEPVPRRPRRVPGSREPPWSSRLLRQRTRPRSWFPSAYILLFTT
jgi:hypothetical protein